MEIQVNGGTIAQKVDYAYEWSWGCVLELWSIWEEWDASDCEREKEEREYNKKE